MDSKEITFNSSSTLILRAIGDQVEITLGGMNLTADAVGVKDSTFREDGQDQTQRGLRSETPVSVTRNLKVFRGVIRSLEFIRQPDMDGLKFEYLGTRGVSSSPVLIQYGRRAMLVPYSVLMGFVEGIHEDESFASHTGSEISKISEIFASREYREAPDYPSFMDRSAMAKGLPEFVDYRSPSLYDS